MDAEGHTEGTDTWDVVVLGAGPAGENAAQYAIQGSDRTAVLIESELVGGECSYWACMPSKALLRPVEVLDAVRALPGVRDTTLDVPAILARRDEIIGHRDDAGQVDWARGEGIDVLRGVGRLDGDRAVTVTAADGSVRRIFARLAVVLATGTTAALPPVPGLAEAHPWISRDVTNMAEVPGRVAIIGGGVVGCESATWLAALGAEVTLIQSNARLLPRNEPFAHDLVAKRLEEAGVKVRTDARVQRVERAHVGANPPAPNQVQAGGTSNSALPTNSVRPFKPGANTSAGVLKDPLWYAAKWGGFEDSNSNNRPDLQSEWDEDADGEPDNYFLVTNALTLGERLGDAFREIARRQGSASSASVNTGSISSETRVYQAKFSSGDWTGQLLSFPVITVDNPATPQNEIGTLAPPEWTAWQQMNSQTADSRVIITTNSVGTAIPFRWASLDTPRRDLLRQTGTSALGSQRLDYLRGDAAREQRNGFQFRDPRVARSRSLGSAGRSAAEQTGRHRLLVADLRGRAVVRLSRSLESAPYSAFVGCQRQSPEDGVRRRQ